MARNSVRSDTPDPTKYHVTKGTIPGTMIPRAGNEGQSLGFDANAPRVVVVDPGEAGGGFSLDMAAIGKSKQAFNAAAARVDDVSEFYRGLSNSMLQRDVSVPSSKPSTTKKGITVDEIKPLAGLPAISTKSDTEAQTKVVSQVNTGLQDEAILAMEQFRKMQNMSTTIESNTLHNHMLQQTQTINLLIEKMNQMSGLIREPAPVDTAISAGPEKESASVDSALTSFQIPFFKLKPERPQFEVYFELAKLGTMSAKYHAVVVGKSCLALVYDTRFEDGFQYLPPNLGEEQIKISVPKLKSDFNCSSLGLHWSLGCLDVVILIQHGE